MGIISFFMIVIILSLCIAEYQKIQNVETEKIIQKYVPDGVLIYGADDSAPPLRFVDEDGVYKGVVVDYVNQLSLELGIEIITTPYKWEDAITALKSGETNLCDMFANEEREKYFTFSDPIYTLRTVVVTRNDKDYCLEDIHSMCIATQKGDYANSYMEKNFPGAQLIYVHDIGEGLTMLLDDKVTGVIGDEPVVSYYAAKMGISDEIASIGTSLYEEPVLLALPKDMTEIVPIINKCIKNINDKGGLEKIQQKWFGISTPLIHTRNGTRAVKLMSIMAIALICAVMLVQLNNRSLRKQVNKRTRELAARNDELQLIFDEMPEGIILADKNGIVINGSCNFFQKNAKKKKITEGGSCAEYLGPYCDISCDDGSCRQNPNCIISETLEKGRTVVKKVDAKGSVYEIRCVPVQSIDEKDANRSALLVVRDITLDEINSRKLLQSSKMIAVGQLAGGMAHQIRNPLGIIRTQSFIIRDGYGDDKKLIRSLDYIDDSVKRASEIIDNVMNFWRVSDSRCTEINIRSLMESVVMLQEKDFAALGISVEVECDTELKLKYSEESLKHILHNLVSNSVDAMENGGDLKLGAKKENGFVQIYCQDTGCGISEENMRDLFNPFFTTKEPGKGTGLGLFIVYSEVEKVGGTIEVKSEKNKGTTFIIRIPETREEK